MDIIVKKLYDINGSKVLLIPKKWIEKLEWSHGEKVRLDYENDGILKIGKYLEKWKDEKKIWFNLSYQILIPSSYLKDIFDKDEKDYNIIATIENDEIKIKNFKPDLSLF